MTPVFFTDRDLGRKFPKILRRAGIAVEAHGDHFVHNAPDEEWIAEVDRRGWFAVTHNRRIRYTPNERQAVIKAGIGLLVVIGKVPLADLAQNFVNTLRRIERFVARQERPFIAKVYLPPAAELLRRPTAPGRIELWGDR